MVSSAAHGQFFTEFCEYWSSSFFPRNRASKQTELTNANKITTSWAGVINSISAYCSLYYAVTCIAALFVDKGRQTLRH